MPAFADGESPQEQIFYAARKGDLIIVEKLLKQNSGLASSRTSGTRTPLHVAAEEGHLKIVDLLLASGADVNVVGDGFSSQGWRHTPLHLAVRANHLQVVERLLDAKANVRARDLDGSTPLHFISNSRWPGRIIEANDKEPELKIAKLLLAHGANLFLTNRFGATPLDSALRQQPRAPQIKNQFSKVIDVLLSEGDPNERDAGKNSILDLSAHYGRIPALTRLLERKVNLAVTNNAGLSPLQIAICSDQQQAAEWLLDHGVTLDLFSAVALGRFAQAQLLAAENPALLSSTNARGDTILHWAARREDNDIAQWLFKQKLSVNAQNKLGETPLHVAAHQKNMVLTRLLIERHAEVNLRTSDGAGALDFAIESGDEKILIELLGAGAQVNPTNKNAKLPLHSAVSAKNIRVAETLLEQGANINARDLRGQTALHIAAARGNLPMVNLLVGRKAGVNARNNENQTPLDLAIMERHSDIIYALGKQEQLVKNDFNLEARDKTGRTSFLVAAGNGDYKVMESLLKVGADINDRDAEGNTALHGAVRSSFQWDEGLEDEKTTASEPLWIRYGGNIGKYLLDNGADPKATNNLGQTPIHMIGLRRESGEGGIPNMKAVVNLLLEHHADINAQDNEGRTPLHLAAVYGGKTASDTLLANGADRNAKDKLGRKPLLVAVSANWKENEYPNDELIQSLASEKSMLSNVDTDGNSPLHLAAKANNFRQIPVLLAQGADKTATNKFGQTPLYFAMQHDSVWFTRSLFPEGVTKTIFQAASDGDHESVKALLEFDLNLARLTNSYGSTPLHSASHKKRQEIVQLLLSYPVEINAQDSMGRTPLHAAAWAEATNIVQLLIAHKANPFIKDRVGRTAAQLKLINPTAKARRTARKEFLQRYWICLPILVVVLALPKLVRRRLVKPSS